MDFEFTGAGGGIYIKGCGVFTTELHHNTEFEVRDVAYVKSSALKGKLEKIAIKKITITTSLSTLHPMISYKDTLNFNYQESDLVDMATAATLISIYRRRRSQSLENDPC